MAEVTGPISTLPGRSHNFPDGTVCDIHTDRTAVARIQGETDSMGCEMADMCQECFDEHKAYMRTVDTSGVCDWCKKHAPKLRDRRDYEEGMHGRVYSVCADCIRQDDEALENEWEALQRCWS